MERPRVLIVGAGFAGIWAAKVLSKAPVDVTLIDRNNYHSFFPLLYQVAAAELEPGDIAYPVRALTRKMDNVGFRLGVVTAIDTSTNRLSIAHPDSSPTSPSEAHSAETEFLEYDYAILSPGSATRYFGVEGAASFAWPLRTLDQAIGLRNHILGALERSANIAGTARRSARTFVIVGGGPTGVEFSGALSELIRGPLGRDFGDLSDVRVIVVEGGPHLLGVYPERLRTYAANRLSRMGVEVMLHSQVAGVGPEQVTLGNGSTIATDTVVWTAGVGGPPDLASWGLPTGRDGTVPVLSTLQLADAHNVYVIGDAGRPPVDAAPMVAQNAQQQGVLAARNILNAIDGGAQEEYRYRDLGNMAVIGRNAAVVHLYNRWGFQGFIAWVMWLTLHLMKLVGFRNRLSALISWAGDYVFSERTARLMLPSVTPDPRRARHSGSDD
jgi:NADH dehydrogenase